MGEDSRGTSVSEGGEVKGKVVVYCDGSYKYIPDGITWEYESDDEYLTTINLECL